MPLPYDTYAAKRRNLGGHGHTVTLGQVRAARGWSTGFLASIMGVPEDEARSIEEGGVGAGTGNAMAYLRALGLETRIMLDGSGIIVGRRGSVSLTVR